MAAPQHHGARMSSYLSYFIPQSCVTNLDRDEIKRLRRKDNGNATSVRNVVDESVDLLGNDRLAFDRMVTRDVRMADAVKALDCVLKGKEGGYPRDFPFPTSVVAIEAYIEYRESLGEVCPDETSRGAAGDFRRLCLRSTVVMNRMRAKILQARVRGGERLIFGERRDKLQ